MRSVIIGFVGMFAASLVSVSAAYKELSNELRLFGKLNCIL
jgi:hypothetical protein